MSADQLKKFITHMDRLIGEAEPPNRARVGCGRGWTRGPRTTRLVSAARRRLVEHGFPEERLRRFPADQLILLDEKREYDVRRDDIIKLMNLPAWQAESLVADSNRLAQPASTVCRCSDSRRLRRSPGAGAARPTDRAAYGMSRPCASTPPSTTARCPRNCPTFPCRSPTTRLPASRSGTKLTGNTAHLRGSPPLAEQNNANFNLHYEVTLQK